MAIRKKTTRKTVKAKVPAPKRDYAVIPGVSEGAFNDKFPDSIYENIEFNLTKAEAEDNAKRIAEECASDDCGCSEPTGAIIVQYVGFVIGRRSDVKIETITK